MQTETSTMRLFTVAEANDLLPGIVPKLEKIKRHYGNIEHHTDSARAAASASEFGGGMAGGTRYVKLLYEVGKLTTEVGEIGIQIKDPTRGLIDFPSLRDGRVVLLCWQLGEGESVEWWHETEGGFAGRQPL
jgi:hypothetical protein